MTRAHLSPYRDATKQVADKLQYFCSASPGTLPSVCAYTLVSLCYRTKNCGDASCSNQCLYVPKEVKVRKNKNKKLLLDWLETQQSSALLSPSAAVTHQVCFGKIIFCSPDSVSLHQNVGLICFDAVLT